MRGRQRQWLVAASTLFLLIVLCVAVPGAHASREDSPQADGLVLDDIAALGEQGMNKLLHWAIEHSDPEELKQKAQQAGNEEQIKSLEERKKEFDEVMAQARQLPSEGEMMQLSLKIASNETEDETTRVQALMLVQELVEDIDLANDLPGMGGVDVLVDSLLEGGHMQLQALRVLHTAASNNIKFQIKVLEKEAAIVPWLLQELYALQEENPCGLSQERLEKVLILLRAIASMSRNLPTSTTQFLKGLEGSKLGCWPAAKTLLQCEEPNMLPPSLQLPFMLSMHGMCIDSADPVLACDKSLHTTHAKVARVAMGLLADLAANNDDFRTLLQSSVNGKDIWQAGILWGGLCGTVKGKGDLPESAVQLLQAILLPVPDGPEPCKGVREGGWPCLVELLEDAAGLEGEQLSSSQAGMSWEQLKAWGAGTVHGAPDAVHEDL